MAGQSSAAAPFVSQHIMGFGGGTHRGQGALPVNLDGQGNATIPLGRIARSSSARMPGLMARQKGPLPCAQEAQEQTGP